MKVVTCHINQFIAVFDLTGMSSDVKNVAIIKAEKDKVKHSYLSDDEIKAFEIQEQHKKQAQKKSGLNFFTRWFR